MPIDPRIAGTAVSAPFNGLEALGQLQQLQAQRQAMASNQALEDERRRKTAQERGEQEESRKLYEIIRTTKDPAAALERARVETPSLYPTLAKQKADLDAKALDAQKATQELVNLKATEATLKATALEKQQGYIGSILPMVEKAGFDPDTYEFALNLAKGHFPDFPADAYLARGGKDPAKIQQIIQSFKSVAQQRQDAELPGQTAESALKVKQEAGTSATGVSAVQQAQLAQTATTATEAARHNQTQEGFERQRIGLEGARVAQAAGDKTDLTPEGLDAAALMFSKTGQLPALGMGDKTTRKAIINRAAALVPGLDVASAKADFGANQASLAGMQKQRDAISAFVQTASKNIDIFLETAGKVVDTGSPFANTAARLVTGRMLGSPDQATYDAARQVAINEVAKITSNPSMAGQLSDTARKEVEAFNPQNATLKQSVAVMRVLKRDMANRASAMDDQITAIKARLGKATGPGAGDGSMTIRRASDGKRAVGPRGPVPPGWELVP